MSSPVLAHPEIMHGTPCFRGTRVPVRSLFDHLAQGYNIDFFLMEFPSVPRELVMQVLDHASHIAEQSAAKPELNVESAAR